ncbi:MAG: SCP2 sterol-binding domain-containing protein [Burkholderiales bacterium]|nr:SCP2 sterol-binding domain-containing protein [Burkholderiales bacterium]
MTPSDLLSVPVARAVEHLLDAAPWAREALRPHAGKTARFVAGAFDLALFVTAAGGVAAADAEGAAAPALTVQVPLAAVPKLMTGDAGARSAARVDGDAGFAQTVWSLVAGLRWDAEGDLARVLGGALAHRVVQGLHGASADARDAVRRAGAGFAEWVSEEARVVVPTAEQQAWQDAVDQVRDAAERLDARLRRLEATAPRGAGS